jgi:DsbC/DsbD-like thiol-disulfide interchange protein
MILDTARGGVRARMSFLFCLGFLLFFSSLQAATGLSVQLVSEVRQICPGQPFYLGLYLVPEPGWHTYWQQPGIVGIATQVRWELPPGFQAGPLLYPAPERTKMYHITAQGYDRAVLLQAQITPPLQLPDQALTFTAHASWMCCGPSCHPGQEAFHLQLPVQPAGATAKPDPHWQPLFEKERQTFPQPSRHWQASAEQKGLQVQLHIRPHGKEARSLDQLGKNNLIFFTEDGWINTDSLQQLTPQSDGSIILTLTRNDLFSEKNTPTHLHGILYRPDGWEKTHPFKHWRFSAPISRMPSSAE